MIGLLWVSPPPPYSGYRAARSPVISFPFPSPSLSYSLQVCGPRILCHVTTPRKHEVMCSISFSTIFSDLSVNDTARIVCGAGSVILVGVHPSVCLSFRSFARRLLPRRVCCWVPCAQEISTDSKAHSSKCEQCHVYSRRRSLTQTCFTYCRPFKTLLFIQLFTTWLGLRSGAVVCLYFYLLWQINNT